MDFILKMTVVNQVFLKILADADEERRTNLIKVGALLKMKGFGTKHDGFYTKNDGFYTKNDGFCTKTMNLILTMM